MKFETLSSPESREGRETVEDIGTERRFQIGISEGEKRNIPGKCNRIAGW